MPTVPTSTYWSIQKEFAFSRRRALQCAWGWRTEMDMSYQVMSKIRQSMVDLPTQYEDTVGYTGTPIWFLGLSKTAAIYPNAMSTARGEMVFDPSYFLVPSSLGVWISIDQDGGIITKLERGVWSSSK